MSVEREFGQRDVYAWVAQRWPLRVAPNWRADKVAEEAGEVMGAVTKCYYDGTDRKTPDDIAKETAQLVMCAYALAESVGFDLDEWLEVEWMEMQTRQW